MTAPTPQPTSSISIARFGVTCRGEEDGVHARAIAVSSLTEPHPAAQQGVLRHLGRFDHFLSALTLT